MQVIAWRAVFEMTCNVSSGTLNLTHSLTILEHSTVYSGVYFAVYSGGYSMVYSLIQGRPATEWSIRDCELYLGTVER